MIRKPFLAARRSPNGAPRPHLGFKQEAEGALGLLHLDQRQPRLGGEVRHVDPRQRVIAKEP